MNDEQFHTIAAEVRILMAIMTRMAGHALERRLEAHCEGLSHLQFGILMMLSVEDRTVSELSRMFRLSPSTLVPAIDALERRGLVQRRRDVGDRRRVLLSLTEQGHDLVDRLRPVSSTDPLAHSLAAIGPEHSQQLLTLLRDVVRHLPEGEDILRNVAFLIRLYTPDRMPDR